MWRQDDGLLILIDAPQLIRRYESLMENSTAEMGFTQSAREPIKKQQFIENAEVKTLKTSKRYTNAWQPKHPSQ